MSLLLIMISDKVTTSGQHSDPVEGRAGDEREETERRAREFPPDVTTSHVQSVFQLHHFPSALWQHSEELMPSNPNF